MIFDQVFGWDDIIALLSFVAVLVGVIFSIYQWRKNSNLKRADYINELTEKIRTDPDIRYIVYLIDYSDSLKPWYDENFHNSGELERKVDKTLSYFSYICYLKSKKIISDDEFKFFKYEIERILFNKQVKEYFFNLFHFANKFNIPFTFVYLFDYGKEINVYEEDFFNKESKNYNHYLNF